MEDDQDFTVNLNPESLTVLADSRIEPSVASDPPDTTYQFERTGYFVRDSVDSRPDHLVFNRTVTLRDSWAKARAAAEKGAAEPQPSKAARGGRGGKAAGSSPPVLRPRPEDPASASRYDSLREEHQLAESEASVLAQDRGLFELFREGSEHTADGAGLAKWIVNEVPRVLEDRPIDSLLFGGRDLARLVERLEQRFQPLTQFLEGLLRGVGLDPDFPDDFPRIGMRFALPP